MSLITRLLLLTIAGCWLADVVLADSRSDLVRLRFLVPAIDSTVLQTTDSDTATQTVSTKPTSSGWSFHLIASGIGVGYTALTTQFARETQTTSPEAVLLTEATIVTANAWDFSLTFGEHWTSSFGVGLISDGHVKSEIDYGPAFESMGASDETLESSSVNGSAAFVNFGFFCKTLELLAGYRWNFIKAQLNLANTSAKRLDDVGEVSAKEKTTMELNSVQAMVGLGFAF